MLESARVSGTNESTSLMKFHRCRSERGLHCSRAKENEAAFSVTMLRQRPVAMQTVRAEASPYTLTNMYQVVVFERPQLCHTF